MTPKRAHYLMIGLVCLLIIGILGAAYGVNNLLEGQSNKLVKLKASLSSLNQEQTSLTVAKQDIKKYSPLYNIAKVVVPENKDQAETVRQIVNLASENGIKLDSITFPASSLGNTIGTDPTGVTPAAPAAGSAASSADNSNLSQLTAVPGIAGVYELPITVQSATNANEESTYSEFIGFLHALENNRNTALISTIGIEPDTSNSTLLSFTLQLNIYIKPGN